MAHLWLERLPAALTGAELALLSPLEIAWGQALPLPRRCRYWGSRVLLRRRLAALLGGPAARLPLQAPPGQPPRLAADRGWLGLSHSGAGLLIGWAPWPIGVDLEPADRPLRARPLLRRFYPAAEARQLEALPERRLRSAVLHSWVLKEAAIKWRRRGLAQELGAWWFDHQQGQLRHLGDGACPAWCAGLAAGWRWAVVGARLDRLELHPGGGLAGGADGAGWQFFAEDEANL